MEFKFIRCSVNPSLKTAFSQAQLAWGMTASSDGFLNQCGGWDARSGNAVVLSSWSDRASLSKFMKDRHDEIERSSGQRETYTNCSVSYLHDVLQIPAFDASPRSDSEFIRIASCDLKPDAEDQFLEVQQTIWNPGMSKCKGMLGGIVLKNSAVKNHFLVVTYWKSAADHQRYVDDVFPGLAQSANMAEHLEKIAGYRVFIESDWQIHPLT